MQELIPIRYGRMLVSPFTFYRGAAAVMAADLAATPDSGIVVQACGDAHISNFGGFAAPDRRLIFGPNDFDETLPGPWEWDVKRMAASVEIAGRDVGLPADRRRRIVTACVREYREAMRGFAQREPPRRLVRAPQRERAGRPLRRAARREGPDPVREAVRARRGARRACGRSASSPSGSTASCAFAASRRCWSPSRDLHRPSRRPRRDRLRPGAARRVRREPRRGPALPVRDLPVRRHGAQGRRRRQRRHARLGAPVRRPRRARTRSSCR